VGSNVYLAVGGGWVKSNDGGRNTNSDNNITATIKARGVINSSRLLSPQNGQYFRNSNFPNYWYSRFGRGNWWNGYVKIEW
jgi:hypothetical protein